MDSSFKTLCVSRFTNALICSTASQMLVLALTVSVTNFSILKPVQWISASWSQTMSAYFFSLAIPLCLHNFISGIFLTHAFLAPGSGKFVHFFKRALHFVTNAASRVFLTWLFLHFTGQTSVPGRSFLYFVGVGQEVLSWRRQSASRTEHFEEVQTSKLMKLRRASKEVLLKSCVVSSMPLLGGLSSIYWCFCSNIQSVFGIFPLVVSSWLLSGFIAFSLSLTERIFHVFMTERFEFPILSDSKCTLADGLNYPKIPLIQHLAAQDLYFLSEEFRVQRRAQVFSLSSVGGHPVTWKNILSSALMKLKQFTHDLNVATEQPTKISLASKPADEFVREKHNQIRNLIASPIAQATIKPKETEATSQLSVWKKVVEKVSSFCEENKKARAVKVLLRDGRKAIWISRGVTAIVCHSLREDRFGVVQDSLDDVIGVFLSLQTTLDSIAAKNLVNLKGDQNVYAIRNASRMNICRLAKVLRPYRHCLPCINTRTIDELFSFDADTVGL